MIKRYEITESLKTIPSKLVVLQYKKPILAYVNNLDIKSEIAPVPSSTLCLNLFDRANQRLTPLPPPEFSMFNGLGQPKSKHRAAEGAVE